MTSFSGTSPQLQSYAKMQAEIIETRPDYGTAFKSEIDDDELLARHEHDAECRINQFSSLTFSRGIC